jgi:hypothetical protein
MTWFLLLVQVIANEPEPTITAVVRGPFYNKEQCIQRQISAPKNFCVVGCMSYWNAAATIPELIIRGPDPTCKDTTLDQRHIDEIDEYFRKNPKIEWSK